MEEEQEIWKVVEGYDGKYKVSSFGKIWNTLTDKEVAQVVTGVPQYKYVNLNINKKYKLVRVHRLVAEAFVDGRSEEYDIVDHIDRDKFNNHYSNLRWTDHSGNQKNTDASIYVFGEYLKDYVKRYENPEAAYSYLYSYLNAGMSEQQAVDKYQEHLDYGLKRMLVEWEGEDVYLVDLCNKYNKDYTTVASRIAQEIPIWNALYNIPKSFHSSLEIPCSLVTGHWFPSKKYLGEYFRNSGNNLRDMVDRGCTYQELCSYDWQDHNRKTVLGVTGTLLELCKHFGKTESSVTTRVKRGMTLEQALTEEPKRVKKVVINGLADSPKNWYESFGLDYRKVKRYRERNKASFENILVHFGVSIENLTITYGDL